MTSDHIRLWTEELARDPASLVFLRLADTLRKRGHLGEARSVVLGGLERHPWLPDAHDVLARIMIDAGEEAQARDEWEMALRLDPGHAGALKGLGFLACRNGDLSTAESLMNRALETDPGDEGLAQVRDQVRDQRLQIAASVMARSPASDPASRPDSDSRPPAGNDPARLFGSLLGDGERSALLFDRDGFVMAGSFVGSDGGDVAEEVGAQLAGLGEDASRALEVLKLGRWESMLVETERSTVAMAPAPDDTVVLVAVDRDRHVGLVRRLLERATRTARAWLESAA